MINEANEPSSACRLWRIFMVETSTPPPEVTAQNMDVIARRVKRPGRWSGGRKMVRPFVTRGCVIDPVGIYLRVVTRDGVRKCARSRRPTRARKTEVSFLSCRNSAWTNLLRRGDQLVGWASVSLLPRCASTALMKAATSLFTFAFPSAFNAASSLLSRLLSIPFCRFMATTASARSSIAATGSTESGVKGDCEIEANGHASKSQHQFVTTSRYTLLSS